MISLVMVIPMSVLMMLMGLVMLLVGYMVVLSLGVLDICYIALVAIHMVVDSL